MNEFLTNLALRAAGIPPMVEPAAPPAWPPRVEPLVAADSFEGELESLERRELPENSPVDRKSGAPELPASRAPTPPVVRQPPSSLRPDTLVRAIPDPVRENQAEHRDLASQMPSPEPSPAVRELVREKETVREIVVEREVHIVAAPSVIESRPPISPTTSRVSTGERLTESGEVIGPIFPVQPAVVMPDTARIPIPTPTSVSPLAPTHTLPSLPPLDGRDLALPGSGAKETPAPNPQHSAADAPPEPKPAVLQTTACRDPTGVKPGIVPQEPDRTAPLASHVRYLRPSPPAEVAPVPSPPAMKHPRQDRGMEVRIGTIEIRGPVSSPPPPVSEPTRVVSDPAEGIESYRSLRCYSAWFRE